MSHTGGAVTQVRGVYMMMGRGLEALAEVPAGCVAAIGGLGAAILKSATLASSPACRPLAPMLFQVGAAATQGTSYETVLQCIAVVEMKCTSYRCPLGTGLIGALQSGPPIKARACACAFDRSLKFG